MARPVDNFEQLLYVKYAPKDVMFSGWVGDQTGNWDGIKVALNNLMHSAWNNYLNFGVDIGGYRTDGKSPLGREKNVFIRWFQLGSFLPLMENGGNGEHRPWVFGQDVLETYRTFATIHTNFAPYFLNAGTDCYYKNISVIKPLAPRVPFGRPETFDYLLHNDIFVSPFSENTTIKEIKFPGNFREKWVYVFNSSKIFSGGQKVNFNCSFSEFPVFTKQGSIFPLQVDSKYSLFGTENSKGFITLFINPIHGVYEKKSMNFNRPAIQ